MALSLRKTYLPREGSVLEPSWGVDGVKFQLKFGKGHLDLDVPNRNLSSVLRPKSLPAVEDEARAVVKALREPIGAPPLADLVKADSKIAILVSDITRPCPSKRILPPLLGELNKVGVASEDVVIIFARGIHRAQTPQEQKSLLGSEIFSRVRVIEHDAWNDRGNRYVGVTSRRVPVSINTCALSCDFILGVANIDIHYFMGYSGGAKSLMPGAAAVETIHTNHALMIHPDAQPGKADGNPVREDAEEAAKMAGLNYILNVALNEKHEITGVFAGDFVNAHRAGASHIDLMYKVPVKEKADVVVASVGGFPQDINLYQAHKGLKNAGYAVRDGGTIILLAECREGLGSDVFKQWLLETTTPDEVIERFKKKFVYGGHIVAFIARLAKRAHIYLVASLPEEIVKRAFMEPHQTVESALAAAYASYGHDMRITVIPYAGSTLPTEAGLGKLA